MRDDRKNSSQKNSNQSPALTNFKPAISAKSENFLIMKTKEDIKQKPPLKVGLFETPNSQRCGMANKQDINSEEKKLSNIYSIKKETRPLIPSIQHF